MFIVIRDTIATTDITTNIFLTNPAYVEGGTRGSLVANHSVISMTFIF